jgi:predicted permease
MPRWTRFRQLFGPDPQGDVDEELAFHLQMRAAELRARGESPERAAELSRQRFGEFDQTRRTCVESSRRRRQQMARSEWIRQFAQDVAYAARTLRRTPAFAAVALLTLALGIGATSTVFSVVHSVLLESLPYQAPDRLYRVRTVYPDGTPYTLSAPDFMSVQALSQSLERVEAYARGVFSVSGLGEPREVRGFRVSRGLFDMLGIGTSLGRPFAHGDHVPGKERVVVLDHGYWVREFGADAGVVGRTLLVAGEPYVVVGVLAPGVRLSEPADVYTPLAYGPRFDPQATNGRRSEFLRVIGRAKPGVTEAEVNADLARVGQQLQQAFRETNDRLTFGGTPELDLLVGEARTPLLMLFAAVALVLLVACANVANLLLARGSARRSELAVRAALGAGRGRLIRQLVAEALLLGAAGGGLGILLAFAGVRALVWAEPADIPRLHDVGVDGVVVAFTFACAIVTALVFGVVPALQSTGHSLLHHVRAGGRGGDGGGGRLRNGLVVAETAFAVVLLVGAGLLVRSLEELSKVSPGFVPDKAMSLRVLFQGPAYAERAVQLQRVQAIGDRLRQLPGVSVVGAGGELPLSGRGSMLSFAVVGAPPPPANVNAEIAAVGVDPDYMRAIGATLLRGRGITADDNRLDAAPVALINEAAVRLWFPAGDPIGARVDVDTTYEVIGVVADIRQEGLGEPAMPQLYMPYARMPARSAKFVLRTSGDVAALASAVRTVIAEVDASVPVSEIAGLDHLVAEAVARPRFYTSVLGAFATSALLLAAIGLFGVLSYAVLQRSREIGVRIALGAQASQVTGMVVGSALRLVAIGLGLGVVGALAAGRLLRTQLFGVTPTDPVTLVAVSAVLAGTAVAASYLPARRAASVDPGAVLREG